jgi:hypothetical protein
MSERCERMEENIITKIILNFKTKWKGSWKNSRHGRCGEVVFGRPNYRFSFTAFENEIKFLTKQTNHHS